MFCTMFDLNTIDYIMEHIELTKIMYLSREPLKRGRILPMFVQKHCSYMPQLYIEVRNCEIFTQI